MTATSLTAPSLTTSPLSTQPSADATEHLKAVVRETYALIAEQSFADNATSCCGATASASSCGCGGDTASTIANIMNEDYSAVAGYVPDADLALGCGIPTGIAKITEGATVLDLGSGAGNDVFVARQLVGERGKVIGVDFTDAMIHKARLNAQRLGFNNVEFRKGDIEQMPVLDGEADVIVSNCVLNLVPNKPRAFAEMFRVMASGGHFSISDIVLHGTLPHAIQHAAEMYAGCVAGAIQRDEYMTLLGQAGFINLRIAKERAITIPDEILLQYLTNAELAEFRASGAAIVSITVYGEKA